MAALLALLVPAGRMGARVRLRAPRLLGAATRCPPPPLTLALLPPGPGARLLRTAGGDCRGPQDPSRATETTGSNISGTEGKQSKSQQLKKIFQEYGVVGMALHIGLSLISLGSFYTAISSGVDMSAILLKIGFKESLIPSSVATGTTTFVVAYAVHKLFAPVRISITVVSVPFVVKYFRKIGLFKSPDKKP